MTSEFLQQALPYIFTIIILALVCYQIFCIIKVIKKGKVGPVNFGSTYENLSTVHEPYAFLVILLMMPFLKLAQFLLSKRVGST